MSLVYRKFDPEVLGAEGLVPKAPLCHRCGREATFKNPVGVTFRPTWNPYGLDNHRHLDALCFECREFIARR